MNPDPTNSIFYKAVAFVNQTSKHLFVTGKAGTGKTTFLKYVKDNTFKKMAVVAPTGVAAINAGGVTIHSFFQLPLGAFIPSYQHQWGGYNGELNNPSTLIKNLRLTAEKRTVIRELDLLVIDEISMVRADLLDAIDTVLRHVRRQPLIAFGGVQVIYIGDLYQLPPVVKSDEWDVLKDYYQSPFFFHAEVIKFAFPLYIELKKIYRQKDDSFIHILNNIRNNCCTYDDLEYLHQYYKPGFVPAKNENYITLTSHNGKADAINQVALQNLTTPEHAYTATLKGEFNDRSYPVDKTLSLKVGAQIMFVKNDKGEARRFYNGKIGTITGLASDKIEVTFANEPEPLALEKETWKNIRYKYQQDKDHVDEEELGTFTQYPLRLAWAITIHKSQGLTFEKAIIDAGASFAPGQVYVSLSRLTSLQGLILYSRILPHTISTDQRVIDFVQNEKNEDELQETLLAEQKSFTHHTLIKGFDWAKLVDTVNDHYTAYEHRQIPDKNNSIDWGEGLLKEAKAMQEVAQKFTKLVMQLCATCEKEGYAALNDRVKAAGVYFIKEIDDKLIAPLNKHVKVANNQQKTKKYVKELQQLLLCFESKKNQVQQSVQLSQALVTSANVTEILQVVSDHKKHVAQTSAPAEDIIKPVKKEKGETQRLSLQLFKKGRNIRDIATERKLSPVTIEGHLADFILTGEIDVLDLVDEAKLKEIMVVATAIETANDGTPKTLTAIKQKLGEGFTYGEIKAGMKFMEREKIEKDLKSST